MMLGQNIERKKKPSGNSCTHLGVRVKRDHAVFSLVFKIGPSTAISMERTRRQLAIDMAVGGPILETRENTLSPFTFTSKYRSSQKKYVHREEIGD